jgi:hypothetical protein
MTKPITVEQFLQACTEHDIHLDATVGEPKREARQRRMTLAAVIYEKLDAKMKEAGL